VYDRLVFPIIAAALPASISQSVLYPAGPQAAQVYLLWQIFAWLFAAIWTIVVGFMLVALFRRRRADVPAPNSGERAVAVAGSITAGILFVLIILSSIVTRDVYASHPPSNELRIHATGHQWWWEFQYQNGPADQYLTTANELHIPAGRPVRVEVTSKDVIHSFWVPNLSPKIDAIPDHFNTIAFQADREGTYRGQCAEFCGLQHAHMGFIVVVESPDKYQAWFNNQLTSSAENLTVEQQRGRQIFLASPCVVCHSIRGTDAFGGVAPDLTHLASRSTIAAAELENTPGNLSGWITDSQRLKPGTRMPPIDISPQDMQPLLSYLEALK
jgi:cytochrome c oxidase subunit 2